MRPLFVTARSMPRGHRWRKTSCVLVTLLLLTAQASARDISSLSTDDIAWLRRDGFGLDTASVTHSDR